MGKSSSGYEATWICFGLKVWENVGVGSKQLKFVPIQTVGYFAAGAKLPGFGSTFRLSSSSPGIVKECSPVYSQIQKMLRTRTSETETLTPRASLPLDAETMLQEEQKTRRGSCG